jgi:hypothetical protein
MKRKPRRLLVFSLGALAAVTALALAGGLALVLGPPGARRGLPDGSVVILEDVGYGRRHVLTQGSQWWRRLAALAPWLQDSSAMSVTTASQDELGFILHRVGGTEATPPRWRMATLDEHGCQFTFFNHWEPASPSGRGDGLVTQALAWSHPRRGDTVRLGIFPRGDAAEPLAVFTTANPTPGSTPPGSRSRIPS